MRLVVEVATPGAVTRNGNLSSEVEHVVAELVKIIAHSAAAIDDYHPSKFSKPRTLGPGGRSMRRLDKHREPRAKLNLSRLTSPYKGFLVSTVWHGCME